jgi:hypothetical protein
MKAVLRSLFLSAAALLTVSTIAQTTAEQQADGNTVKKHLKVVTINDGTTTKIDTVTTGDEEDFTWLGDPGLEDFFGNGKEGMPPEFPDSLMRKNMKCFRFDFNDDEKGRHPRMRMFAGPDGKERIREFEFKDGDSIRHKIFIHRGEEERNFGPRMLRTMRIPAYPAHDQDLIDLNDPNILSFERKELSGGREKIEIIRKKTSKKQVTTEDKVIVNDRHKE